MTSSDSFSTNVLSGWSPLTTRLLQEGGSVAWNAIDGILWPDGSDRLDSELDAADLWNKLVPARTQGDAQRDELVELLRQGKDKDSDSAVSSVVYNVRGDSSLLMSREYIAESNGLFGTTSLLASTAIVRNGNDDYQTCPLYSV
jgi:hypothetical protein